VAGLRAALGGFCDDRINSIAGPNPHKGASRGTPDFVSQDTGRWALHLLQRGRPERPPTLLLLHGFPSSSRMFEPLVARLSDRYHLVAPDYPGFGHSDCPDPKKFAYTFDHIAEIMNHFTEALGLSRYTLDMQDYGGPVGFRMVLAHPEGIEALIVQDAVAHNSGLGRELEDAAGFLGRSRCQRKRATRKPPFSRDDADTPRGKRSQHGTV